MKYNNKKPAGKKRRTTGARKAAPRNFDGQKLLLSSYAEISMAQDANSGVGGVMGYSLICDPLDMKLKLATSNATSVVTASDGVAAINSDNALSFARFDQFKEIYRQYKVDWVKVAITTDRDCGLDNPVITLTDKGDASAVTSIASAMSQAHKEAILTESKRTCSYGWKPSTSNEKEYRMTNAAIGIGEQNVIKVLQDVEPKNGGVCKHRVTITASVTLKDSKSPLN